MAVAEHDAHSSFIKTPKQLIIVVALAFLVPVIGIVMIVHVVTSLRSADPGVLAPDSVAARIAPVGRVEFGAPPAPPGARSGEQIVKAVCATCHEAGLAGAMRLGDKAAWSKHIKEGLAGMVKNAINGIRAMPPRGGDPTLTDLEVERAVVYMANLAGANFKEPPAPKEPAKPEAPTAAVAIPPPAPAAPAAPAVAPPKPMADGKGVYAKACVACHQVSIAGSPPLGDEKAWGPRIAQGMDALVQSVVKGKGAMPPRGGNPALTDAEIRAAVEFMVAQSK
jgi:cytochrome c5